MTKKLFIFISVLIMSGCASTYKHVDLQAPAEKLNPARGVLISIPEDGWYENTQYKNSGKMTANAVRAAFAKNAKRTDLTKDCKGDACLNNINLNKYGYFVKPVILRWEDRATEWSGRPDQIEIQIIVFDAATRKELANSSYSGKSKWATLGGDHPQDLLPEPTNEYVRKLYP